jgi:uncharacterized protein YcbX
MTTTISRICTWPVKGLNEVSMEQADLVAGAPLPLDRAYGIARGSAMSSGRDPSEFGWKDFIQLKNCPRLATLTSDFDLDEQVLTLKRQGRQVAKGNLSQQIGRTLIEQFLTAYLKDDLQSPPKIVGGGAETFTDARKPLLSIINLETLRDIERVSRSVIDLRRMRGNLYVDGLPAWAEFDMIGQEVTAGSAKLKVVARIDRCAATHVNPDNGERDLQLTRFLQGGFGHMDCGVFAEVIEGGEVKPDDGLG